MEDCGTQAKVRRYVAKRAGAGKGAAFERHRRRRHSGCAVINRP